MHEQSIKEKLKKKGRVEKRFTHFLWSFLWKLLYLLEHDKFDQTKIEDKDARNKIVWLSGLYLQMARGLHNSRSEVKARGYYHLADTLVKKYESAYDLFLRRSCIESIRELFT